ncbi:hypothetical protein CDG77_10110 [Nostoc sp. 'Peltigera membranacea cyanobiont' 213]|uniref:hypothetical protein n=1 Tax=unclassified Nostoc TaxID=2593658 RepID=UPI000B95B0E3|nr:hypothetical protein [Nostoc sp. 'Peltigera membranacea cyanobiont' 213]OYD95899.1 hypothetical protein CDG77_10110 [Nostoc sp. 'Peltigera membranacea cyanobiont' 213]
MTVNTTEKLNKIIETQQVNKHDIQQDIYEIGLSSVTSNALTVLVTLSIVGFGIFILGKKVTQLVLTSVVPGLKSYLSTQESFIKAINSNSEEIKKNLITLERDTNTDHIRIIDKLTEIELDVKEIKIIISSK